MTAQMPSVEMLNQLIGVAEQALASITLQKDVLAAAEMLYPGYITEPEQEDSFASVLKRAGEMEREVCDLVSEADALIVRIKGAQPAEARNFNKAVAEIISRLEAMERSSGNSFRVPFFPGAPRYYDEVVHRLLGAFAACAGAVIQATAGNLLVACHVLRVTGTTEQGRALARLHNNQQHALRFHRGPESACREFVTLGAKFLSAARDMDPSLPENTLPGREWWAALGFVYAGPGEHRQSWHRGEDVARPRVLLPDGSHP